MQPIVLYQPTQTEITQLINRGKAKHSAVAFLYDDAQRILTAGHLGFAFDLWHCLSQSDASKVYQLYNGQCTCKAYEKGMYQLCGHRYCKHNLAYFAYQNLVINHLNDRLIGNIIDPAAVQRMRSQPHTWLLQNGFTPGFISHNGECGYFVCYATLLPAKADQEPKQLYAPSSPLQLARFSSWLATTAAHPLPTAWQPITVPPGHQSQQPVYA